jgi:hypothetical protein
MAELALRFLTLLRTTECPTLIGILTPYWKAINNHRRDPKHLTKPLPWTFKEVYDDLINSNITILYKNKALDETLLTDPIVAKGLSTVGIHHTKGGRRFLTVKQTNNTRPSSGDQTIGALSQQKAPCKLCLNKHPNPWHSENNCPYKHPTHIIPKDVWERVMQHNALHGAENKAYSKNQDTPSDTKKPPLAAVHSAIIAPETTVVDSSRDQSNPIDPTTDSPPTTFDDFDPDLEIVDTEYFDIPSQPAVANGVTSASSSHPSVLSELDPDEFITDNLQYLSYNS